MSCARTRLRQTPPSTPFTWMRQPHGAELQGPARKGRAERPPESCPGSRRRGDPEVLTHAARSGWGGHSVDWCLLAMRSLTPRPAAASRIDWPSSRLGGSFPPNRNVSCEPRTALQHDREKVRIPRRIGRSLSRQVPHTLSRAFLLNGSRRVSLFETRVKLLRARPQENGLNLSQTFSFLNTHLSQHI
jgi:hypothetical protein